MAHVSIISSQSGEQIFEGAPRYVGAYLKPGYLEFPAIGSPTAISWHVGDYVVYPRTGKTYRLYRTPQIAEQGDTMRYGAAFLYENVQFFDDSKQLELCPFIDLVPGDNTIHFSTQNVVSFFGKPLNVAERLQACLEAQYGAGTWAVRIVTTTDTDLLELLDTEVEFSVSGASCQRALDKVYELWNGLGWIHTVENGVNVITIGASNVRTNANTTVPFAYGDGLVRVERSIANADEIGTRLFAYGSMKNMDATYYRGLNIYHADSVDIEHLMIPLSEWGLTDGQPDARKAFIEDASAIAKLGLIPRTAYFDGTGDLPDIHPTIERMTVGEVYDAGGAGYLPNLSKWSRSQRIDEIISAVNPTDHGTSAEQGQKYTEDISSHLAALTDTFINNDTVSWTIFSVNTNNSGRLTLNFGQEPQPITLTTAWNPQLDLKLAVYAGGKRVEAPLTIRQASSTAWQIILPESVSVSGSSSGLLEVRIEGVITNTVPSQDIVGGTFSTDASTTVTGGVEYELSKTFTITIPQIGFDIEKYAALGNGKTISMKTGMCSGRDFEIKSAKYVSSTDSWLLTLYRSSDEDLGIMFPNADYQIAAGDQYVLLDIAMPDMYVTVASSRLLEAARKLLANISSERPFYSPQIDAKVVYNESRVLLEGMWMDVAFDSSREYVLIDSITIDENGSNIPTYEVSLREKKGVEWTENVGKSSSSKSSVSVNGNETEQETGVRSVGMTVPEGLTVQGSPITGAGVFKVGIANGYKIPLISELANYFELAADPTIVQLRQAYSYLGPRKGLIFDANAEADTNADFEKVALPGGGYALHSRLPFYSDSFISAGGISSGGGGASGITWDALAAATNEQINLSHLTGALGGYYTKAQVDALIGSISGFSYEIYPSISAVTNPKSNILYLIGPTGTGTDKYEEYVYSSNTWTKIGDTSIDLSGYLLASTAASTYATITSLNTLAARVTTDEGIIDDCFQSLQSQVDSVSSRDNFDELTATAFFGDTVSASALYAEAIELAGEDLAATISDLAGHAETLEGYFTNGSAKTAIQLLNARTIWGQNFNGTANVSGNMSSVGSISMNGAISGATTISASVSVTSPKFYLNASTYFELDSNGYVHLVHPSGKGFYADGFISAGGISTGGGASGIDLAAMWASLTNNPADSYASTKIAAAHIPDMASTYGYAYASALSAYQTKYAFTINGASGATYNLASFVTSSGVTSVATGTGLAGGTITGTGTISISSTYQTYIANGNTAYGWGDWRTRVGTLETNLSALTSRVAADETAADAAFQSLQSQIDSVSARNNYDEITATVLFGDQISGTCGYFEDMELGGYSLKSIPNAYLANSAITINGVAVSLGGTRTITQAQLLGTSAVGSASVPVWYNGSAITAITPASMFSALSSTAATNLSVTIAGHGRTITDLYARYDKDGGEIAPNMTTIGNALRSLQSQVDSVSARNGFDELYTTTLFADMFSVSNVYAGAIDATGTIHATTGIWSEGYVSAGGLASSSDERMKSGIKDFGYSAEMLMALRPREWDWNEKSYMKGHAAGVVAQELRKVMPYAIVERQYLSVNYDMLHGLEIAGLQDHETRIRQLERENAELKRRLNMN